MPVTVTLPTGDKVKVGDEFLDLPDEGKRDFLAKVAEAYGTSLKDDAPPKPPEAPKNGTEGGFWNTLQAGVSAAGKGLADTAEVVGQKADLPAAFKVANTIRAITPDAPKNYREPVQGAKDAWNQGDYLTAVTETGRAGLQAVPDLAATLAAAATPGVGLPAAAAYIGARNFGPNVRARQEADGRSGEVPTTGDMAVGGLVTGAQAAMGGLAAKIPGIDKIASIPLRVGAKIAAEGAENAASDVIGQAGTTAGTKQGLTVDLGQTAVSAGAGLAARGATMAPKVAGAAASATGRAIGNIGIPKIETVEQAASVDRVNRQIADVIEASPRKVNEVTAANSVRETLRERILNIGRSLRESETISREDFRDAFRPLTDQAARHNQTVTDADWSPLAAVREMNIPEHIKAPLLDAIADLDTLSQSGRLNRASGPAERILGGLGALTSAGIGGATGGMAGFAGAAAGAAMGHSFGQRLGKGVGRGIDKALGMQLPDVVRQADAATRFLKSEGVEAGPTPMQSTMDIMARLPRNARQQMGLPDTPDAPGVPKGVPDPTTGAPFRDVTAAINHALESGEAAIYAHPGSDIQPFVITPEQAGRLADAPSNPKAVSDSFLLRRLAGWAQEQKAQAERIARESADAEARAAKDQEAMDATAAKAEGQKAKETEAALRENEAKKAADAKTAAAKDAAFATAENADAAARAAAETDFARRQQAEARGETTDARRAAADGRREAAAMGADLATQARSRAAIEAILRKEAAGRDRADTRTERAADWVSGVAFRQGRAAETPDGTFARTGGREGNPALPSDPLMVRADGTPIDAPSGGSQRPAQPRQARPATTPPAPSPEAVQTPPQAIPGGVPSGRILANPQWLSWMRQGMERAGVDPTGVTFSTAIEAAHSLADAGIIPRDFATRLETYHGPVMADRANPMGDPMHLIAGRVAEMMGKGDALVNFSGTGEGLPPVVAKAAARAAGGMGAATPPEGARPPVFDPFRWLQRKQDVKAHVASLADEAARVDNWPELGAAIREVGATPEAKQKSAAANAFLASLPMKTGVDRLRHELARRYLTDKVLRKGI